MLPPTTSSARLVHAAQLRTPSLPIIRNPHPPNRIHSQGRQSMQSQAEGSNAPQAKEGPVAIPKEGQAQHTEGEVEAEVRKFATIYRLTLHISITDTIYCYRTSLRSVRSENRKEQSAFVKGNGMKLSLHTKLRSIAYLAVRRQSRTPRLQKLARPVTTQTSLQLPVQLPNPSRKRRRENSRSLTSLLRRFLKQTKS